MALRCCSARCRSVLAVLRLPPAWRRSVCLGLGLGFSLGFAATFVKKTGNQGLLIALDQPNLTCTDSGDNPSSKLLRRDVTGPEMRGPNIKPQILICSTVSLFKGLPNEINNFNSKSSLETTCRGHMCQPRRWIKSCVACQDSFCDVTSSSNNGDGLDPV